MTSQPSVLILTPVKNAALHLSRYFALLDRLTYPAQLISLGLLESDSTDGTYEAVNEHLAGRRAAGQRAACWKKDFGYQIPRATPRWAHHIQIQRRSILAKSRNHLLSRALSSEEWVLWLDVDVCEYPPDIIERLLAVNKDIVQPHCVRQFGGATFDRNAWRDGGLRMDELRPEGELVRLHAVGGTMLLVRADAHREGLIFPTFLYGRRNRLIRFCNGFAAPRNGWQRLFRRARWLLARLPGYNCSFEGEIETEGFGMMADDMGYECWGLPHLEILHHES